MKNKNKTYYGKIFEEKTCNYDRLLDIGYKQKKMVSNPKLKSDYYLIKKYPDKKIIFVTQSGLKRYCAHKNYDINVLRYPDEAFIIEYYSGEKILKILEKKEQHVDGSIDIKLWGGPSLKREYEIVFSNFTVEYAFCVNDYIQYYFQNGNTKYEILDYILDENGINVFFGDDPDYFEHIDFWIKM